MSRRDRLERLRASLEPHGLDGLVVSQPESRYYLSGYTGHDLPPRDSAGYLLITASQAMLLTDPRTAEQASNESPDFEVITYASGSRGPQAAAERAAQVGIRRLGFESIHLPYAIWEEIRRDLPASIEFVPVARLVERHALVLEAQREAERQVRPGMTGREGDALAREVIRRAGYGEAFTHGLGHGIGLEVHEPPWLSPSRGDDALRAGMVFSVEPG